MAEAMVSRGHRIPIYSGLTARAVDRDHRKRSLNSSCL